MGAWDYDGPDCEAVTLRRARKSHVCCGCGEVIVHRHRYRHYSGVWDGRPSSFKYCLRCSKLIDIILESPGNEGFVHRFACGHSWEDVFDGAPPEDVAALAFLTPDEAQRSIL